MTVGVKKGVIMADAFPAMRPQGAASAARSERPTLRPSVANAVGQLQKAGFQKNLAGFAAETAEPQPVQTVEPSAGRSLLSNGGNLLLAESRTHEAESGFTPTGAGERARDIYLSVQGRINDSLRAARYAEIAARQADDEAPQKAALALAGGLALSEA